MLGSVCVLTAAQERRSLRERIPKADPEKYKRIQDGRDWANPYLVTHGAGIEILNPNGRGNYLTVANAMTALESLPDSAWPYGLVVAVEDAGIVSSMSEIGEIRRLDEQLDAALSNAGVAVTRWPSA